jgi:hypothetical protein
MTDTERKAQAKEFRKTAAEAGVRLTVAQATALVTAVEDCTVEEAVKAGTVPATVRVKVMVPACSCCPTERDVVVGATSDRERWLCRYFSTPSWDAYDAARKAEEESEG